MEPNREPEESLLEQGARGNLSEIFEYSNRSLAWKWKKFDIFLSLWADVNLFAWCCSLDWASNSRGDSLAMKDEGDEFRPTADLYDDKWRSYTGSGSNI